MTLILKEYFNKCFAVWAAYESEKWRRKVNPERSRFRNQYMGQVWLVRVSFDESLILIFDLIKRSGSRMLIYDWTERGAN